MYVMIKYKIVVDFDSTNLIEFLCKLNENLCD